MTEPKTSTFIIHHDRCKPTQWTANDVLTIAKFLRTGGHLLYAADLARLGMQLVTSEHHVPKGGTLEEAGFTLGDEHAEHNYIIDDLTEVIDDQTVTAVQRVYKGPVEYIASYPVGDGMGNFEGYDYEFKQTEAEALQYLEDLEAEWAARDSLTETAQTELAQQAQDLGMGY